jgi:hypothetical protein
MRIRVQAVREVAKHFGPNLDYGTVPHVAWSSRFRAHFVRCDASTVKSMWNLIDCQPDIDLNPSHIIWILPAMAFLQVYPTTHALATQLGVDKKTVRKYVWQFTEHLARLEVVCTLT